MRPCRLTLSLRLVAIGFALAIASEFAPASAADTVHAGKAAAPVWTFTLLDIGIEQGIFAKYGLDVDITSFAGDAKIQQAMASGSIDFGLGSGPSMAFAVKGIPVIAVAAFAREPRNLGIIVAADSPAKTAADLKGKLVAVTTAGSLTEWLVKRMAVQEGWGVDGIRFAEIGSFDSSLSALKTHQVDAMVGSAEGGYLLEERGTARVLLTFEKYAPQFHTHIVFARKQLVADNPDLVSRFLKGVFASIAFMKANREKTTEIATRVLKQSPAVMNRAYDTELSMFEDDGRFDPAAIAVLKQSFVEMGMLNEKPADDQLFTTRFLPVKP
jgi:ABC-type nitrate/sulfonate/bicarbonate transport system substrate-binding protein